jgi:pimeloyl-ACP methyl ester carboxylesterase
MPFWVAVALAVLVVIYLGIGLLVAVRFSAPNRQPAERTPADAGLTYREASFESTDGVPLAAWWVPPTDGGSSRAAVLVHGWEGDKSDRHVIETAPIYARAGYGVLLLDLRGNGASGSERRTLGYKETHDVRGALAWLEREGYEPERVVLHGWSMGAATVVRSAPGSGVAAVIGEAGYADLPLILRKQLPESSGLLRLFNPGIFLAAKLLLGLDLVWRGNRWVALPEKSFDPEMRRGKKPISEQIALPLLKNSYRVLCSRAMRGCSIFCMDEETAEYLRQALGEP